MSLVKVLTTVTFIAKNKSPSLILLLEKNILYNFLNIFFKLLVIVKFTISNAISKDIIDNHLLSLKINHCC